jgi:hypothetical protein
LGEAFSVTAFEAFEVFFFGFGAKAVFAFAINPSVVG